MVDRLKLGLAIAALAAAGWALLQLPGAGLLGPVDSAAVDARDRRVRR